MAKGNFCGLKPEEYSWAIAWIQMVLNSTSLVTCTIIFTTADVPKNLLDDDLEGLRDHEIRQSSLLMILMVFGLGIITGILLLLGTREKSINKLTLWSFYTAVQIVCCLLCVSILRTPVAVGCVALTMTCNVTFVIVVISHLRDLISNYYQHLQLPDV